MPAPWRGPSIAGGLPGLVPVPPRPPAPWVLVMLSLHPGSAGCAIFPRASHGFIHFFLSSFVGGQAAPSAPTPASWQGPFAPARPRCQARKSTIRRIPLERSGSLCGFETRSGDPHRFSVRARKEYGGSLEDDKKYYNVDREEVLWVAKQRRCTVTHLVLSRIRWHWQSMSEHRRWVRPKLPKEKQADGAAALANSVFQAVGRTRECVQALPCSATADAHRQVGQHRLRQLAVAQVLQKGHPHELLMEESLSQGFGCGRLPKIR